MIDVSVLVDKLHTFESPDEIALFLESQGVKATPRSSEMCAISEWISKESGKTVTTSMSIKVWSQLHFNRYNREILNPVERYSLTLTIIDFIRNFDKLEYPNLIKEEFEYDE